MSEIGPGGQHILTDTEVRELQVAHENIQRPEQNAHLGVLSRHSLSTAQGAAEVRSTNPVGHVAQVLLARSLRAAPRSQVYPVEHYQDEIWGKALHPPVDPSILLAFIESEPHLRACCDVKADDASRQETKIMPLFASKCMVCAREFQKEVEKCPICTGEIRGPDMDQERKIRRILRNPNPEMTWKDIRKAAMWNLEAVDDVWLEVQLNALGEPEFWIASPTTMRFLDPKEEIWVCPVCSAELNSRNHRCYLHETQPAERVKYLEMKYSRGGDTHAFYTKSQMLHYNRYGTRFYGNPPTWSLRHHLRAIVEAVMLNADQFEGQNVPNSVIGVEGANPAEAERLHESWQQSLDENSWFSAVVGGKVSSINLYPTNRDMQFLQLYIQFRNTVCATMKTPLIKLGISDTGGAGMVVGWQLIGAYWDTVEDGMEQFDEAICAYLRRNHGITDWKLESETSRPYDMEKLHTDERQDITSGVKSINEVRIKRGLPPIKNSDGTPNPAFDLPQSGDTALPPSGFEGRPAGPVPSEPAILSTDDYPPPLMDSSQGLSSFFRAAPRNTPSSASVAGVATVEGEFVANLRRDFTQRVNSATRRGENVTEAEMRRIFNATLDDMAADYEAYGMEAVEDAYIAGVRQGARDVGTKYTFDSADQAAVDFLTSKPDGVVGQLRTFDSEVRAEFEVIIRDAYADPQGFNHGEFMKKMRTVTNGQKYKLERIARSETTLISNMSRDRAYELAEKEMGEIFTFAWVGPNDGRNSDICPWIKKEVRRVGKGKGVMRTQLKEIIERGIAQFGTGGSFHRPHANCRHTQVRTVN